VELSHKMLEIHNLCKSYKSKQVLNGLNMALEENHITAFLGGNGAGKSTTIKCIAGINKIDSGSVETHNHQIGVLFDDNGLYLDLTAIENIMIFLGFVGRSKETDEAENILNTVGLLNEKNTVVKKFSKGMKRRLAIARMIIFNPNILILDEPFDGIDAFHHRFLIDFLKEWVKKPKKAILFSSHIMSEIEDFGDVIYILKDGKAHLGCSIDKLLLDNIIGVKVKLRNYEDEGKLKYILTSFPTVSEILEMQDLTYFISCNTYINSELCDCMIQNNISFDELTLVTDSMESIFFRYTQSE